MKLPLTINNNHDATCGEIDMDEDVWVNEFLKMGHSFILSPVVSEDGKLIEVSLCEIPKPPKEPICANCGSKHIRLIFLSGTEDCVGILCDVCGRRTDMDVNNGS